MSIQSCQLCGVGLNQANDSKEHIIPNSIGGMRKISGFICNDCNKRTGKTWDAALASQLNWFSLFAGIVRERGTPPPMTVNTSIGPLKLHHDGTQSLIRPVYEVTESDGIKTLNIQARNVVEAHQLLQRAKSQYPNLDVEAVKKSLHEREDDTPRVVHTSVEFGGNESGRSLVKSCLALAFTKGIGIDECPHADLYLNKNGPANYGYFYDKDLVLNRPVDSIFHCVSVIGNADSKMLLGYVEFFSVHRVVVCFSDAYEGESFNTAYAIDPRTGLELQLTVELPFTKEDIVQIYDYERMSYDGRTKAMEDFMRIGYAASLERQRDRVFENAIKYGLKACGLKEGDVISVEQAEKLSSLIVEKITPYLLRNIQRKTE